MKEVIVPTPCLTQDEIRQYLQEDADDEMRYRVENHLLDCPLCNAAVEGLAAHYNFAEDTELDLLTAEPPSASPSIETPARQTRIRPLLTRVAAAAIVLLIGVAAVRYYVQPPVTSGQLFQSYYDAKDVPSLGAKRSTASFSAFADAQQLYQQGQFQKSQAAFAQLMTIDSLQEMATLYAGLSALAATDEAAAMDHLEMVRQLDAQHWEDATWYLAMAYLRQGDQTMVKILLEELLQRDLPYYRDRASQLLTQLKE